MRYISDDGCPLFNQQLFNDRVKHVLIAWIVLQIWLRHAPVLWKPGDDDDDGDEEGAGQNGLSQ